MARVTIDRAELEMDLGETMTDWEFERFCNWIVLGYAYKVACNLFHARRLSWDHALRLL